MAQEIAFKSDLNPPKTDAKAQKYLKWKMRQLWTRCIREFLFGVRDVLDEHVDTGMTLGSLYAVARESDKYRKKKIAQEILNFGVQRESVWDKEESYFKTKDLGIEMGKQAYTLDLSGTEYWFTYEIVIKQWRIWEGGFTKENGQVGLAWNALYLGVEAFERAWDKYHERYIDLDRLLNIMIGKDRRAF